jgi:hypothetical protein
MNPWRAWLATFLGTILVALSAVPFVGNAIPSPHGSFIPMLEGHDFVRDEFVRAHALKETSSPCVAFFGDNGLQYLGRGGRPIIACGLPFPKL